jgi:hypothetical protein
MTPPTFILHTIPDTPGKWWPEPAHQKTFSLADMAELCHTAQTHTYQLRESRIGQDVSKWFIMAGNTHIAMTSDLLDLREPEGATTRKAVRELMALASPRNLLALVRYTQHLEQRVKELEKVTP